MNRFFNTTGPCDPRRHYMLPPEARLPGLDRLVEREQYFVLHAARQTGKTTAMRAFAARLRERGIAALHATLEASQGAPDVEEAEPRWLSAIASEAPGVLRAEWQPPGIHEFLAEPTGVRLGAWLSAWCRAVAPTPIVLLLDEADVVSGPALVNLLRQLRAGFHRRPGEFPASVALVGMRDLRDYLVSAKDGATVNPGSPFNIKAASLTLRNFLPEEVAALYAQHTDQTGQVFTPEAVERVCWWTGGQPFLVNALAAQVADELLPDRSMPVRAAHIDEAKERLVLARTTHLDSLGKRLDDPRVAATVQAILLGDEPHVIEPRSDDFQFVCDLGLVEVGPDGPRIANPLYREVLARELSYDVQHRLPRPWWPWRRPDGGLDMPALVDAFLAWWRENAEILREHTAEPYREATAHLAFMGFLQRVVNAGGRIYREYAAGRGRLDLLVEYGGERHVIELKRVHPRWGTPEKAEAEGTRQLAGYLDTLGLREGWLILFNPRPGPDWEERLWQRDVEVGGNLLHVRGG